MPTDGLAPVIPIARGSGAATAHDRAGAELSEAILAFVLRRREVGNLTPADRLPDEVEEARQLALGLVEVCDRWRPHGGPDYLLDAIEAGAYMAEAFLASLTAAEAEDSGSDRADDQRG